MKHIGTISFIVGLVAIGVAAALGTSTLASKYLDKPDSTSPSQIACSGWHAAHLVKIENNAMVPSQISAKLCDTLTITDADTADKLVAFGVRAHHVPYDGVAEKLLSTGDSLTVTLNQVGKFHFHDHLENAAQGDFTVTK